MAWEYRVLRDMFDDELGPLARDYVGSPVSWVALGGLLDRARLALVGRHDHARCAETADVIVLRAMDEAGAELRAALGEPDGWNWGRLHTATFQEATSGRERHRAAGVVLQRGPVAAPGAAGAVNNTLLPAPPRLPGSRPTRSSCRSASTELFTVTNLPSYRLAIDMSDLDGARIVITTGQSGQPVRPATTTT